MNVNPASVDVAVLTAIPEEYTALRRRLSLHPPLPFADQDLYDWTMGATALKLKVLGTERRPMSLPDSGAGSQRPVRALVPGVCRHTV